MTRAELLPVIFYGVRVCDGDGIVVLIMKAAEQDN